MLIEDRIKLILKANNLSPSEFADKVDIKRANLSHVLSGRNKPSLDFLSKVINSFPNVNASWLLTGETREGDFKGMPEKSIVTTDKTVENGSKEDEIERIVIFFKDGSYKQYSNL